MLADLILVGTAPVHEVAAELAVPDVQGFGPCAPGVGCKLNAKAVGEFCLKGVPVGEIAHELGLHPVPLLGHSGETLVEVLEPLVMCSSMHKLVDIILLLLCTRVSGPSPHWSIMCVATPSVIWTLPSLYPFITCTGTLYGFCTSTLVIPHFLRVMTVASDVTERGGSSIIPTPFPQRLLLAGLPDPEVGE